MIDGADASGNELGVLGKLRAGSVGVVGDFVADL